MRKFFFIITLLVVGMAYSPAQERNQVGAECMPADIAPIVAPFNMPQLSRPVFAERRISIVELGAKEGKMATKAIQKAINRVSKAGGGHVVVPAGNWLSGRITLKDNVDLHLEKGAQLHFSGRVKDYLPVVLTRNEGVDMYSLGAHIYALNATNIAITGEGELIGPGTGCEIDTLEINNSDLDKRVTTDIALKDRIFDGKNNRRIFRPTFIGLIKCRNILVEGIRMTNTIFWNIVPEYCENVIIRGVRINSYKVPRGDAIDISSTKNTLIEYCTVNTTDDAYTLKSGRGLDGLRANASTENVVIRHCYAENSAGGVAIGTECAGGIRNVYVTDCLFERCSNGSYIKTRRPRGGGGSNIVFEHVRIVQAKNAFYWDMLGNSKWMGELAERLPAREINELTPEYRDFQYRDISVEGCRIMIRAKGLPERPIKNVLFEHVSGHCERFIDIADMENVTFRNCKVEALTNDFQMIGTKNILFDSLEIVKSKAAGQ